MKIRGIISLILTNIIQDISLNNIQEILFVGHIA